MRTHVIILDGNQRSALAAVRALGARDIPVIVGADLPDSLAAVSRYCKQAFVYPSPYQDPEGFLNRIIEESHQWPKSVLMPMTDVALSEILKHRGRLPKRLLLPFPEWEIYQAVSNKIKLFRLASRLNLPIPRTLFSSDFSCRADVLAEGVKLGFPLVLKPGFSRLKLAGKWVNTSVRYVLTREDFQDVLEKEPFLSAPFLVQEKIEGPGIGVFLLREKGNITAQFAHQRIREKPPSGGVSVLCRSIELPQSAFESSCRLLENYGWDSVAMVEFKLDTKTGCPRLMEINARFWGSLQLAISSGVDFPYLLYAHATGETFPSQSNYRIGVKSRWELGDLDHLIIRIRQNSPEVQLPLNAPSKPELILRFISDFFRPSVNHEVFRIKDLKPFASELRRYLQKLLQERG